MIAGCGDVFREHARRLPRSVLGMIPARSSAVHDTLGRNRTVADPFPAPHAARSFEHSAESVRVASVHHSRGRSPLILANSWCGDQARWWVQ